MLKWHNGGRWLAHSFTSWLPFAMHPRMHDVSSPQTHAQHLRSGIDETLVAIIFAVMSMAANSTSAIPKLTKFFFIVFSSFLILDKAIGIYHKAAGRPRITTRRFRLSGSQGPHPL